MFLEYTNVRDRIIIDLKKKLDYKRYIHTIGVSKSAIELCDRYDCDKHKAELSALLHDIAKQLTYDEEKFYLEKYNIEFDDIQKKVKQLHHAKIAYYIAKYEYGIIDEDVLNAVKYHTTGRDNMSMLEKIICLADYIEENRNFDGVDNIRHLANSNLDEALYYALNSTILNLSNNKEFIHIDTLKARNYLLDICNKNK